MKNKALAARYRPQTFSAVVGQELATTALARAAAEDRVAPAYLFSGTRGVGKTTVARIFAKALNCAHAPVAEPCNQCGSCVRITGGSHVDVNEIDGASNTGVDDVRALRENMGFMPMEGRYKVFIIDEAHMLSKSAFNALLKTLEEPPPRTVFIFATTEAHRFPATIVSRCQHYVFRHLPEDTIFQHLRGILAAEDIAHDDEAVRMIARRASGSARDSLSLLDQALSVCQDGLRIAPTREALGLAGQDFFAELLPAIAQNECAKILGLSGKLLGSGVDIGFFMRDLAANLRNLFLARQVGDTILPSLGLTENELAFIKKQAGAFSAAHLHAAWQMVTDSQRSITQSLEPGAALELLLINLAMLPMLLPVGAAMRAQQQPATAGANSAIVGMGSVKAEIPKPPQPAGIENAPPASGKAKEDAEQQKDWAGFCQFCRQKLDNGEASIPNDILRHVKACWNGDSLVIEAPNSMLCERLLKKRQTLEALLRQYMGDRPINLEIPRPPEPKTHQDLLKEYAEKPEVQLCTRILGATLTECHEKNGVSQEKQ